MQWTVRPYTPADEAEWDRFVMHESGNGTFLQTRNFLNYHPAGRFTDASLMVYNEHGGLGAVVPAALRLDGATRIFRSHPGSTFGGPVLRSTYNSAAKSIGILQAVEDAASAMGRVCAFVVFFLVLLRLLEHYTGAWGAAAGVVELTNGILRLTPGRRGFVLASSLLGWGGLSVHCQTAAVTAGSGMRLGRYLAAKAVQSVLAALLALLAAPLVL